MSIPETHALYCTDCGAPIGEAARCAACGSENRFRDCPLPEHVQREREAAAGTPPIEDAARPGSSGSLDSAPAGDVTDAIVDVTEDMSAEIDRTESLEDAPPAEVLATLLCEEGPSSVAKIDLAAGEVSVGRSGADIDLDSRRVSKMHALLRVERAGGAARIEVVDRGSQNGTYLNDERIAADRSVEVRDRDRVRFADVTFRLRTGPVSRGEGREDEGEDDDPATVRR